MGNAMTRVLSKLAPVAFFLAFGTGAQAGLQEGLDAYRSEKYGAAIKEFTPLAARGNAVAQFHLGMMNDLGQGVSVKYKKAAARYLEAAGNGHVEAQFNLGAMYRE